MKPDDQQANCSGGSSKVREQYHLMKKKPQCNLVEGSSPLTFEGS
jgi:hypothetical protein